MNSQLSSWRDYLLKFAIILAVALVYLGTAQLGLILAIPPGFATPIWPSSGIAVAALLLVGNFAWPGILLGSFFTNVMITSPLNLSIEVSLCIAIGSTVQALVVAYCIKKSGANLNLFSSHKCVLNFFVFTLLGCTIACTVGTATLLASGVLLPQSAGMTWLTWLFGDSVGIFIFTPFVIAWVKTFDPNEFVSQFSEVFQLSVFTILMAVICFWNWFGTAFPIAYVFLPLLLYSAFRFEPYGPLTLLVFITGVAVWGTVNGFGPFVHASVNESLLLLQFFFAVLSGTTLTIISIVQELNMSYDKLEEYSDFLKDKVDQRTTQLQKTTTEYLKLTQELQDQNTLLAQTIGDESQLKSTPLTTETTKHLGIKIREPIASVINFTKKSSDLITEMIDWFENLQTQNPEKLQEVTKAAYVLKTNIQKIYLHGQNANQIIENILPETAPNRLTDLNGLVIGFTNLTYLNRQNGDNLNIILEKNLDSAIGLVEIIPQDFSRAFMVILNNAFDSILQRKDEDDPQYVPKIWVRTKNLGDRVAVVIRDNGLGISKDKKDLLFSGIYNVKHSQDSSFGLSKCYDVIVKKLGGEIMVDTVEEEFAEFTMIIPKKRRVNKNEYKI